MWMDGVEYSEHKDEGRVKTFAPPEVLAAILNPEESLETLRNDEENDPRFASGMENGDHNTEMSDRGSIGVDEVENPTTESEILRDSLNDSLEYFEVTSPHEVESQHNQTSTPNNERSTTSSQSNTLNKEDRDLPNEQKESKQSSQLRNGEHKKRLSDSKQGQGSQPTKPKPRTNFIDKNKELGNQRTNNGYAAKFRQKAKLKNAKETKVGIETGQKENSENVTEDSSVKFENSSEQYDNFDVTANSSFTGNPYGNYSRTNSYGSYFSNANNYHNPENSYYSNINATDMGHVYQGAAVDGQNQYINQPYQTPYKDFGLRYSNYGQRSYQMSSAITYPYNSYRPSPAISQGYSNYASQSAPPGGNYYKRQPLMDRVEFFPEYDYELSNSHFINDQRMFQDGSILQRRYASEPHLSHSPSSLPDTNGQDRGSKSSGLYASPRQPVDYKPYTLKDYRQIKDEKLDKLGSLGPNTDSDEYKDKINKLNKQKEYAEMLRNHHAAMKPHWEKNAAPLNTTPARLKQADAKRKAAINYAKTVPKPKVMPSRRQPQLKADLRNTGGEAKEVTLLELLKMRHEKEKNEVEVIRKSIAAKVRQ